MLTQPQDRSATHVLGDWTFHPAAAELRCGAERRRLENRAARVLELLCKRRDEVVSQEQLVDQIWGGRALSQNSVAVVVGDLRRALGDDARQPRYIETVSKRGYRLIAAGGEAPATPTRPRQLFRGAAVIALLLLVIASLVWVRLVPQGAPPVLVVVEDVINATGDPAHDATARSVTEVILAELGRTSGVRLARQPVENAGANLTGRLVIWTGQPALGLSATNPATGQVLWTGMARGPEPALPDQIRAEITHLAAAMAASEGPAPP